MTDSLANLLNQILGDEGFLRFRKPDLQLTFMSREVLSREGGSLRLDSSDGAAIVVRAPEKMKLHYRAHGSDLRVSAWDRLTSYFFDHPAIEPFVPEHFQSLPGLYQILTQEKAIVGIEALDLPSHGAGVPPGFALHYTALYHSGQILDREALVKQRVIEYRNRERSVP